MKALRAENHCLREQLANQQRDWAFQEKNLVLLKIFVKFILGLTKVPLKKKI